MNRRSRGMWGGWKAGLPGLLALALAGPGLLPSPVAAAEQGRAEVPRHATGGRARAHRSGLEARVATLTRALDLDARQQAALRKVLLGQREQVQRIWRDESVPSADRVAMTRALSRRTADQIRALLNDEQRRKYDPPPQGGRSTTVRDVRVEDWMKGGAREQQPPSAPPPSERAPNEPAEHGHGERE